MNQMLRRTGKASDAHQPSSIILRRLIKGAMVLGSVVALGMTTLLVLLWFDHRTEITLPAPTGNFPVGRTSYMWVNSAQVDELALSPGMKRKLAGWVWYPASEASVAPPADYLPEPWRVALASSSGFVMSQLLNRDLRLVRVHSTKEPPVAEKTKFPVVILRPGGSAMTTDFTTLAEDLASHGYVVVGFDAPYRSAVVVYPDSSAVRRSPAATIDDLDPAAANVRIEKLLPLWTSDVRFVVDQLTRLNDADPSGRLTGTLDIARVGAVGHSFGGSTALQP